MCVDLRRDDTTKGFPFKDAAASRGGLLSIGLLLLTVDCAPVVKRDFSNLPAGRIGFDDMCALQDYFDDLSTKSAMPPMVVSSSEIEKAQAVSPLGGRSRFAFESDFQLKALRRVLRDNWERLPDAINAAPRIDVEVEWSSRSGLQRVVTNRKAQLSVGRERWELPYQVCLSELLFGEPLYRRRREVLGLPPLIPNRFSLTEATPDGGSAKISSGDGGNDSGSGSGSSADGGIGRDAGTTAATPR